MNWVVYGFTIAPSIAQEQLKADHRPRGYTLAMTSIAAGSSDPTAPNPNRAVVAISVVLLIAGWMAIQDGHGWRQGLLYIIGGALGVTLYHAAFGFTSAWRSLISDARGEGVRAQMLMLALATLVFIPVLNAGTLFGQPVGGAVAPVGTSVAVGAFLFGIGMQLGGGCASGTLFTVGGGNVRMAVTLAAFIAGSVIATAHAPWWYEQPSWGAIALGREFGTVPALALQLAVLTAIAVATMVWERKRHATLAHRPAAERRGARRFVQGPWPLIWAAAALAALNVATLAIAGHPWSITFGFGLWGAKLLSGLGIEVASWEFWTWPYPARALKAGILADTTSVMNFGIVLGALLAAGLAGKFRPTFRVAPRPLVAAMLGGLMLGYGARLAFGCNIGAFFSGVASGSVHGWLWLVAGLAGNMLGVRLRPLFFRDD